MSGLLLDQVIDSLKIQPKTKSDTDQLGGPGFAKCGARAKCKFLAPTESLVWLGFFERRIAPHRSPKLRRPE